VIHNIDELPRFMLVVHQDALVSTLGPCSLSLRSIVHGPLNATADPRGIVPSPESMVIKNVMFSLGSFSSITCTTARFGAVCSSSWIPAMPQCSMSKIRLETLNKGLQCKAFSCSNAPSSTSEDKTDACSPPHIARRSMPLLSATSMWDHDIPKLL
jgi:hypothetical protein